MDKDNLEKKILKDVFRFEKQRTTHFVEKYLAVILLVGATLVFLLWQIYSRLVEQGTWDLLTIFQQDQEIIREYWQDTMGIFIAELPHRLTYITFVLLVILILAVIALLRNLPRIRKVLRQVKQSGL